MVIQGKLILLFQYSRIPDCNWLKNKEYNRFHVFVNIRSLKYVTHHTCLFNDTEILKLLTLITKPSFGHDSKKYINKFWCFGHIERRKKERKRCLYVTMKHRQ